MKTILFFVTIFFFFSTASNGCELYAPKNILMLQKNIENSDIANIFKANDCQEEQLTFIKNKIMDSDSFSLTDHELLSQKISILNALRPANILTLSSCKDIDLTKEWNAELKIIEIKGNHFDCTINENVLTINTEIEKFDIPLQSSKKFPFYKAILKIDMASGELSPDFFKLEFSDVPVLDAVISMESVQDYKLTRSIGLNETLTHKHLKIKKTIMPGRIVALTASSNGIELESTAMALESGGVGEIIKVQNMKSKKIFMAKIQTSNSVRIEL
jgi:flagella basal body P-ring formation protein FlgA